MGHLEFFQRNPGGRHLDHQSSKGSEMNIEPGMGRAAQSADEAIRSTRRAASKAFDSVADTAQEVGREIAPSLSRATEHAKALAQVGKEFVRDGTVQLRGQARRATDTTVAYIRDEPVKAMLIAAAAGAALMAVVRLSSRSRDAE
jgi:ElaB/YqjD/DUF883 family membrane-anchored ribosome-binding protein